MEFRFLVRRDVGKHLETARIVGEVHLLDRPLVGGNLKLRAAKLCGVGRLGCLRAGDLCTAFPQAVAGFADAASVAAGGADRREGGYDGQAFLDPLGALAKARRGCGERGRLLLLLATSGLDAILSLRQHGLLRVEFLLLGVTDSLAPSHFCRVVGSCAEGAHRSHVGPVARDFLVQHVGLSLDGGLLCDIHLELGDQAALLVRRGIELGQQPFHLLLNGCRTGLLFRGNQQRQRCRRNHDQRMHYAVMHLAHGLTWCIYLGGRGGSLIGPIFGPI